MRFRAGLLSALIGTLLICQLIPTANAEQRRIDITGIPVPAMSSFDSVVSDLMARFRIPGGALAVAKDGRLVLAHGYGLADVDVNRLVQPDSLFRIASISKSITAVAILKLVEEGRLDLNAKAFLILDRLKPKNDVRPDPRIWKVTIRQLLQHSGGWDRSRSFDPMFMPREAAAAVGAPAPASCETIIRYMFTQPLDFDPGARYAYSNFGYCVLGRIIEQVTGRSYEEYVKRQVLEPMGITDMRIGHSSLEDRADNEVRYYDFSGTPPFKSVFTGEIVLWPYGGFYLEAMDSHGGWLASAIDLALFAVSVDGQRPPAFLRRDTVQLVISRPAPPLWVGESYWYGMGWFVRPVPWDGANWWHTGSLPGTSALLVKTHNGLTWAALFNSRPEYPAGRDFITELDNSLWLAQSEVTAWPAHDLFAAGASNTTQASAELTLRDTSYTVSVSISASSVPTTVLTRSSHETETAIKSSTQAISGVFTVETLAITGVASVVATLIGTFCSRRWKEKG